MHEDAQHSQDTIVTTKDLKNNSNNIGLWILNLKTLELSWGQEAFSILNKPVTDKFEVSELLSLLTPDSQQILFDQFKDLVNDQKSFTLNLKTVTDTILRFHGQPIFLSNVTNSVMGFIQAVNINENSRQFENDYISHLEEMLLLRTKENESLQKKLDVVKQSKNQCLSKMSHEIRTPMNAIVGYAHLIQKEPLSIKQKDQMQELKNSVSNLSRLINHLLDVEKMETDNMIPDSSEFNPHEMIKRIVDLEKEEMKQKGINFNLR